jgi:hypothetical protein
MSTIATTLPQTAKPVHVKDMKEGDIYKLETRTTSPYSYTLFPGIHILRKVEPRNHMVCSFNVTTGTPEVYYGDDKPIPFLPVPEEEKPTVPAIQVHHPSAFVLNGFGADRSLGTDPEVFVVNGEGVVIPAYGFLIAKSTSTSAGAQATSYHARAYGRPYWDGFQGEFTTVPFACIAHLTDCIQAGLDAVYDAAIAKYPDAKLVATPVLPIPGDMLRTAEDKHVELGCMPSENVYGHQGAYPGTGRELPIRFAGLHVHMAIQAGEQRQQIPSIIRMMDKLCGVTSVAALQGLEDSIRRRYYGLAGEHRLPKHGLEWRVLSSAVLWHPAMVHLHFNLARVAAQLAQAGLSTLWQGSDEESVDIINNLDIEGAKAVIQRNRELFIGVLKDTYFPYGIYGENKTTQLKRANFALDEIILRGFKEHIDLDMKANWSLGGHWTGHSGNKGCIFAAYTQLLMAKKK